MDRNAELHEDSGSNFGLSQDAALGRLARLEEELSNTVGQYRPVLMAISCVAQDTQCSLGLAFVDMERRILGVRDLVDDSLFAKVESALVAHGCRECLVSQETLNSLERRHFQDVFARCDVTLTAKDNSLFHTHSLNEDLTQLVKGPLPEMETISWSKAAQASLAALISFTELVADRSNHGRFTLMQYDPNTHMRLDAAALRALNVFQGKPVAHKTLSLFELMNRTCTEAMGKRLLQRWLRQPLVDPKEINYRLDIVEEFQSFPEEMRQLRHVLGRIPDVQSLVRRVDRGMASLEDILKLYQVSVEVNTIGVILEELGHVRIAYELSPEECDALKDYQCLVEAAIDLKEIKNGEYVIAADYDDRLQQIIPKFDKAEDQIREAHEEAAAHLNLAVDTELKLEESPEQGHVLRIDPKAVKKVRHKLHNEYITLDTCKDGIHFTNENLRRLSANCMKLRKEYNSIHEELINDVIDDAGTFVEVFEGIAYRLAEMDVLLGFALLAGDQDSRFSQTYERPSIKLGPEDYIFLGTCRHPCLEVQTDVQFQENDIRLTIADSEIKLRGGWFQIFTGPNTGGKSTLIQQVGMNVLMAQVGSFIPCELAEINIRNAIFTRMMAGAQLHGVSTFMCEMSEIAIILKYASPSSLVLIDELGSGTSSFDGLGLAWAMCEHLVKVNKAPTLLATRFLELTALAGDASGSHVPPLAGAANFHMSGFYCPKAQRPVMEYWIEHGPCDKSFLVGLAELANFPPQVLELAKEKAAELESSNSQTLRVGPQEESGAKWERVTGPDAALACKFMKDFVSLSLEKLSPKAALTEISRLRYHLRRDGINSPWLQQFC